MTAIQTYHDHMSTARRSTSASDNASNTDMCSCDDHAEKGCFCRVGGLADAVLQHIKDGVIVLDEQDGIVLYNIVGRSLLTPLADSTHVKDQVRLRLMHEGEELSIPELTTVARNHPGKIVFEQKHIGCLGMDGTVSMVDISLRSISHADKKYSVFLLHDLSAGVQL